MKKVPTTACTYKCKVVMLGEQSVGKSSLALRYVQNTFSDHHAPTVGAAYLTKQLTLSDYAVKFEIWDTAGQERFRSIAPMYYRGSNAAVVVYDITKPDTFTCAQSWISELHRQADDQVVIALVGNKADLQESRAVPYQKVAAYAEEKKVLFLETSAKTNLNVNEIFLQIGIHCPRKTRSQSANSARVNLSNSDKQNNCC